MNLCLALVLSFMAGADDAPLPAKPLFGDNPAFPIGERLIYEGKVTVGGVNVKAGTATFTVTEEQPDILVLRSVAVGEKLGYRLETSITSKIHRRGYQPLLSHYRQRGSETREKKLRFTREGAVYLKVKHCRTKGCRHKAHMVDAWNWVGIIPWGTRKVHCTGRRCKIPAHQLWRERGRHRFETPCLDLLTAVYYARSLDFGKVGSSWTVPVVHDRDRWNVKVRVRKRGKITVGAGTFDAVEVVLEPQAVQGDVKEKFKGLFGLNGAIEIWMDRKTRRPLEIHGKIPFAFMNLDVRVQLIEIGTVKSPGKGAAKPESAPGPTRVESP